MSNDKGMVTVKAVTPVSTDDTDDLSSFVLITHERAFTLSWTQITIQGHAQLIQPLTLDFSSVYCSEEISQFITYSNYT